MHICKASDFFSPEQASLVLETINEALEQADEVLQRHTAEDPPNVEELTTGEGAEAFASLISTQMDRIAALQTAKSFFEEVK